MGVAIPDDFDRRVISRNRPALQLLVDGTDPIILGVAEGLATIPVRFDSQTSLPEQQRMIEVRNYYNPERRSAVNIVPSLVGVVLTMTMVLFTGVAIVRERERGNLELLINTPVRTVELMLGKIVPYIVIGLIQLVIILAVGPRHILRADHGQRMAGVAGGARSSSQPTCPWACLSRQLPPPSFRPCR